MDNVRSLESVDHGIARVAVILMPLIGGMSFVIQPGFVQGLVVAGGFSEREAGLIASAEMAGFAFSAIVLAALAQRLHWGRVIVASLALSTVMNVMSAFVAGLEWFAVTRFISGIGSGGALSLGFAAIGMTQQTERNFGWNIVLAGLVGSLVMFAVPSALRWFGLNAFIGWFVCWNLLGLFLAGYMPRSGDGRAADNTNAVDIPWTMKLPALCAIFVYFTAQGAVWAYLFLIGTSGGISERDVANGLTLAGIAGIAGGLTPVLLGDKVARLWPLAISVLLGMLPMLVFLDVRTALAYTLAACMYNFVWNVTHPYLLATYAAMDRTGRVLVYASALQTIGMTVGPAVGAAVISPGRYTAVIWMAIGLFVITLGLVLPAAAAQARKSGSGLVG
jgi:predicted MFS family arabinose efflux permease